MVFMHMISWNTSIDNLLAFDTIAIPCKSNSLKSLSIHPDRNNYDH
jgi:hypothetical protein